MNTASKVRVLICLFWAVCWPLHLLADEDSTAIVVEGVGFATPESVEYYADEDVYLVTNINGDPFDADGNGFISKLSPDGSVMDLKWIDGAKEGITLNAPKGAAIAGNNLFVADRNQVHVFELPSGAQKASITIEGSTFLNGITPACGGYVYVTDSGYAEGFGPSDSDTIYKVRANGNYETVVADKNLGHPNGILEDDDHLMVVTFGSGELFSVNSSGKITAMPTPPNGGLDGLIKINDSQFAISSWGGSAIYIFNRDGTFSTLAESLDAPADLGVDTKRNRLLIPLFKQNKVIIKPL
ncbi:SMP-30/gluconolactonase/LRE family protein [Porticoccus sp.]